MTYKVVTVSSRTGDLGADLLKSGTAEMHGLDEWARETQLKEENRQKLYTLGKSYDTVSGRIVTMTGKGKDGERAPLPRPMDELPMMERGVSEPGKVVPILPEFEVLQVLADEKSRRGPEVQTPKRKLSESLTPIKEAESRLQSPEDELKKTPKLEDEVAAHPRPESVWPSKAEQAPESEVLKVGLFGPRRKSLSEWRYSEEPGVTIATAHYVTESSASRVVVTSGCRSVTVSVSSMTFSKAVPSSLSFSVPLAAWLCVKSSRPGFFIWFTVQSISRLRIGILTLFCFVSSYAVPRCVALLWLARTGEEMICLNRRLPALITECFTHRELVVTQFAV